MVMMMMVRLECVGLRMRWFRVVGGEREVMYEQAGNGWRVTQRKLDVDE
jgi:hypothetical protein